MQACRETLDCCMSKCTMSSIKGVWEAMTEKLPFLIIISLALFRKSPKIQPPQWNVPSWMSVHGWLKHHTKTFFFLGWTWTIRIKGLHRITTWFLIYCSESTAQLKLDICNLLSTELKQARQSASMLSSRLFFFVACTYAWVPIFKIGWIALFITS